MWNEFQQARLDQLGAEISELVAKDHNKSMLDADWKRLAVLNREAEQLVIERDTYKSALKYAGSADPNPYGGPTNGYGDHDNGIAFKGFGTGVENRIQPPSIYQLDKTQIAALKQAAQQNMPLKIQIGSKGVEHGFMDGMRQKSAITEGGMSPNLLPPLQQYGPNGWFNLPYEITNLQRYIPVIPFSGPGVAWWRHDSNGAEAAYTPELGTKPDTTPSVSEQYTRASKFAGRYLASHELIQDAGDAFGQHLTVDLTRSLVNAVNYAILNGASGTIGWNGLNNVSGTLTQAIGTDTALDCISKAMVALRNDFFVPDLLVIHPSTLGAIRRSKDTENRYLLQLVEGSRGIDQTSDTETLWGMNVVQTTQQAAGTAVMLSVQSGAAVIYLREAANVFFDPYSMASSNTYQFIAETRLALATPRPSAICLLSGLPTS
ncbi:MAG: phage major capsid protein [Actinomycetota bacterium]|nr:phage major capsid protein [Actinomycetota bacterium]